MYELSMFFLNRGTVHRLLVVVSQLTTVWS